MDVKILLLQLVLLACISSFSVANARGFSEYTSDYLEDEEDYFSDEVEVQHPKLNKTEIQGLLKTMLQWREKERENVKNFSKIVANMTSEDKKKWKSREEAMFFRYVEKGLVRRIEKLLVADEKVLNAYKRLAMGKGSKRYLNSWKHYRGNLRSSVKNFSRKVKELALKAKARRPQNMAYFAYLEMLMEVTKKLSGIDGRIANIYEKMI